MNHLNLLIIKKSVVVDTKYSEYFFFGIQQGDEKMKMNSLIFIIMAYRFSIFVCTSNTKWSMTFVTTSLWIDINRETEME